MPKTQSYQVFSPLGLAGRQREDTDSETDKQAHTETETDRETDRDRET